MTTLDNLKPLEDLEEKLVGANASSTQSLDTVNLNVAATLASLAVKLLDVTANVYQVHGNVVRLGHNLDILVSRLQEYSTLHREEIADLKARVSDLEAVQVEKLRLVKET